MGKDMTIKVRKDQRHVKEGYTYIPLYASFVADLIKVICGNARLDLCSSDVQYFSS